MVESSSIQSAPKPLASKKAFAEDSVPQKLTDEQVKHLREKEVKEKEELKLHGNHYSEVQHDQDKLNKSYESMGS